MRQRARTARALASFERSVGLDGATDDDGRSFCHEKKKRDGASEGRAFADLPEPGGDGAEADGGGIPQPPTTPTTPTTPTLALRRSVLVLLASDGFERGTSVDDDSARIDAIDAAMEKLRVFDADATCHVPCVAPARDEETRAATVAAMTRCAACARDEKERKEKKTRICVSFPAALTDAHRDTCGSSCASCGASLIQTRNIVWSAAGFGKTHAACGAFPNPGASSATSQPESRACVGPRRETSSDLPVLSRHLDASSSPPSSHETTPPPPSPPRLDGRLACGTEHAHAQEMLSALSSSSDREPWPWPHPEPRLESETMAVAVETRRVRVTRAAENANETNVTNETNASNTTLRVERHVARFHAGDVFRTVAALTKPLASVRAGRPLETRAVDAETSRETLRLVPESASRRAAKNARAFDERLELWLRVDGALEIVHVRDPQTSAKSPPASAPSPQRLALRRIANPILDARAQETAERRVRRIRRCVVRRCETRPSRDDNGCFSGRETDTHASASERRVGTRVSIRRGNRRGFAPTRGFCWPRNAEDGANALASFAEKVNDPPTLSDVAGVPPDRLNALALAARASATRGARRVDEPPGRRRHPGPASGSGTGRSPGSRARARPRARRARRARRGARRGGARRREATERRQKRFEAPRRRAGTRGSPRPGRAALRGARAPGSRRGCSAIRRAPCVARTRARTNRRARHRRVETRPSPAAVTESRGGAARVAKRGLIAHTKAASVPMPAGERSHRRRQRRLCSRRRRRRRATRRATRRRANARAVGSTRAVVVVVLHGDT